MVQCFFHIKSFWNYFIKTSHTASTISTIAAIWFQRIAKPSNITRENTTNTTNVITSWMIFNCISEKGPPLPSKPMRFAGTWRQYSTKAIPHDRSIISHTGHVVEMPAD